MTKLMKYLSLFAVIVIAFAAADAFAASGSGGGNAENVFETITERMVETFQNVRAVIFIVGGFGLVGLGFAAIFGKVNWKWLAALAAGLAIVAVAGAVVDYVTQADSSGVMDEDYAFGGNSNDTLTD